MKKGMMINMEPLGLQIRASGGIFVKNKRFLHPAINGLGVEMTWCWAVLCRRRWTNMYIEHCSSSPKLTSTFSHFDPRRRKGGEICQ